MAEFTFGFVAIMGVFGVLFVVEWVILRDLRPPLGEDHRTDRPLGSGERPGRKDD